MKRRLTFSQPALLLAGLLIATGCTDPVVAEDGVATVNGTSISKEVFNIYARNRTRQEPEALTDEQREMIVKELQDIYLLADLAKAQKLDRDPEVVAQLDFQRRSILAGALANNFLEENPATDEEIQAEYEATTGGDQGQEYKARHILLETQEAAAAVIAELDGGADFETLAKEKSTGPSGPSGGDLGWFAPNRMVPPFSAAVVALADNAYSKEPVQTDFGWHVILREGSRQATPPPLETMKPQIKPRLEQKKFQDYIAEQREKAKLTP